MAKRIDVPKSKAEEERGIRATARTVASRAGHDLTNFRSGYTTYWRPRAWCQNPGTRSGTVCSLVVSADYKEQAAFWRRGAGEDQPIETIPACPLDPADA